MKISNHLPFFDKPNLLVVAGKQEACFYLADKDKITQADTIKLKKPEYTDREGRFDKRGNGRLYGSGSVYEFPENELAKSFIRQVSTAVEELVYQNSIKNIFLFCPTYLSNLCEQQLSAQTKPLLEYIFYGNYHNQHPFVLLAKIQEYLRAEDSTVKPITGEAFNILHNKKP
jgi:hypothetical protein